MKQKQKSIVTKIVAYVIIAFIFVCTLETVVSIVSLKSSMKMLATEELTTAALQLASQSENEYDGEWSVQDDMLYKGEDEVGSVYEDDMMKMGQKTGLEYSIVYGDTVYATTLKSSEKARAKILPEIATDTLSGKDYFADGIVIGTNKYYGYYTPLKGPDGNVVGSAFAGRNIASIEAEIFNMGLKLSLITAAIIIVILFLGLYCKKKLGSSMNAMNKAVTEIAEGNLRMEHDVKALNRSDEIGIIARSMKHISEKLTDVIGNATELSGKVSEAGNELKQSTEKANTAGEQVSKAVQDISNGAQDQAESVQKSADNVSAIGSSIEELNSAIEQLKSLSVEMKTNCNSADKTMTALISHNKTVTTSVESISQVVNETAASVQAIQDSTSAIAAIAAQTNLLSLNASIEAARAGEAGKGFAVVAKEIQDLATQSKDAASKINDVVENLAKNSAESTESLDELRKAFAAQNEQINEVRTGLSSISESAESVSDAAEHSGTLSANINNAKDSLSEETENLSAISEENAASAEETSASMEELSNSFTTISDAADELQTLAAELDKNLNYFKI